MNQDVLTKENGALGIITLNRPKALNALTLEMIAHMHSSLNEWEQNKEIQAVLLHSSERKSYCAGGDIRWLYESGKKEDKKQLQFFRDEYRLNYRIANYGKPVIALTSGLTMGGGIGISLHAALPVASDCTVFAMPETSIGFFPDIGASYFLSRCAGAMGMYLALTGNRFDAYEAQYLGLLTYVVEQQSLDSLKQDLVTLSLENANSSTLEACIASYTKPANKPCGLEENLESINEYFSQSSLEEIFEKLAVSDSSWAQNILTVLKSKSPLSLKITFEQIQKAKKLSLGQCLEMDYILAQHFMKSDDFYEGVRAMVIDKDKNPRWKQSTLEAVSSEMVKCFFSKENVSTLNITSQPELLIEM